MICSRVSAGLRGNGLRAALGTSTAKVEASGERDGVSGVGLEPGGLGSGSGSFPAKRRREERSPHPNSRRRPALPGRGGGAGSPVLAFGVRSPPQLPLWVLAGLPGVIPFSLLSTPPPPPFPNLLGNPNVSISAVTVTHTRGQAVPVKLFLQLAFPQSPLFFSCDCFLGVRPWFWLQNPWKAVRTKEPWRSEVCNSPCDFDLLPHMEEGRFEFPSRVSHSFPGPGWSVSARNSSYSGQHLSLGFRAKEKASCLQKESCGG